MSPRERALALGWVRRDYASPGVAWVAEVVNRFGADFAPPVVIRAVDGLWACVFRGVAICPTEDEALAHALLLRDVVLS